MKTLFINGSPKKRFSVSSFFIDMTRLFAGGESITKRLRTKADGKGILPEIEDGDNVVFALPLYVDGVPSHVLYFLKDMEKYCKKNSITVSVYVICNNGFIEGSQSKPQFRVFENFCARCGANWQGGLGIGGGVMINVMRIMLVVYAAMLVLSMIASGAETGNFFPRDAILDFVEQFAVTLLLFIGVIFYTIRMGMAVRSGKSAGENFTRILLPSFVFIIVADIFFTVTSIFKGGIFRGWFARKTIE